MYSAVFRQGQAGTTTNLSDESLDLYCFELDQDVDFVTGKFVVYLHL